MPVAPGRPRPPEHYRFPIAGGRAVAFAGSTHALGTGEPWYALGEVTTHALDPEGYVVEIRQDCPGGLNPQFVADGRADLGCTVPSIAHQAWSGTGRYDGQPALDHLRAVATICRPSWLAVAVRRESGITDLSRIKRDRLPVRVCSHSVNIDRLLGHYDLSMAEIESYGGSHVGVPGFAPNVHLADVDLLIGQLYIAHTPVARGWIEASVLMNLKFLELPSALIDTMTEGFGGEEGYIPSGYLRGVDAPVHTVSQPYLVVYTRDDAPDDFVTTLARSFDRRRRLFRESHVNLSYDPFVVAHHSGIPLHPAAEAYYAAHDQFGLNRSEVGHA